MHVEILPEVFQRLLADRLALSRFQELCPQIPELLVRDRGEGGIRQHPPANARGLFEVSGLHVVPIQIEKIQKGILVKLVLDVAVHHLMEKPLGLRLEAKGIQQPSTSELAANLYPNPRIGEEQPGAAPVSLQRFIRLLDLNETLHSEQLCEERQI